jgi:hypothetical protein
MPKPMKFSYEKKVAFRDASYFIIVCEGQNREPEYFGFFDGMSSRVKIVAVNSAGGQSAPQKLIQNALAKEDELSVNPACDCLWFVIDTDRWGAQIRQLREACNGKQHWFVAQSNPCFEVWLYFHARNQLPALARLDQCNHWKPYLPTVISGGFNSDIHPIAIETAAQNARDNYKSQGFTPDPGSTQVWELAASMIPLIKKDLDRLKPKFPMP